ncbi:MAG: hypothetical protein OQL20_05445, partial [Sedimenticola sp.]|nr:hypothetical protein [Sedimenticola sp.]
NSYVNYYIPDATDEQMLYGYWSDNDNTYNSSPGDCDGCYSEDYTYDGGEGSFVGGIATSQADLNALNAGNIQASYAGRTGSYSNNLSMDVNFGNATWSAAVNGGSDGSTYSGTDSFGAAYIRGQVGFYASGTISGANIASNSISADDSTNISGSMNGTFFGSNAAGVGGLIDITKSGTGSRNDNIRLLKEDVRIEQSSGYTNARYVDTFQGVKVDTLPK